MERTYWTKIRGIDETFGNNDYVLGRIGGFMEVLCGKFASPIFHEPKTEDAYMSVKCTERNYQAFRKLVEERYPNLCEFDVDFER